MSDYIVLVHGDLLTKERIESIQASRQIEETPKRRTQYVLPLMGLFHFKMACADAFWKIWILPKEGRLDCNSLWQHIGILRAAESNKFNGKPGFHRVHDIIHQDLQALILDCWRVEVKSQNSSWNSLNEFAASNPTWGLIVKMSEDIVKKFVATTESVEAQCAKSMADRDICFENQTLRNRDELLYVDLSLAMNEGDVGRVEASFLPWINIFKAVGKHKYAAHTMRFMYYMRSVYPEDLKKIIRQNWLCNPTGQRKGFRAIDWLVERINWYLKVFHAGSGPTRTIKRVINESPLIEIY
ncbi:hypothetical protein M378DRAFT_186629 [Amanita muscaria Koide BX008]|uniref:DUF6589 domain-containing protein n=1 Tax=Amanita muscaria (strain Koide BX008) TaxID=946122 RepID=A0A0C2WT77_AMAMK|nr:hypothetical protein M378DRAFT_186629 [Amanita muscaria Koide BX008]